MTKICTSIEQSKKLAEILPLESADMCFINNKPHLGFLCEEYHEFGDTILQDYYPCWSLVALLNLMICPNLEEYIKGKWDLTTFTDESLKTPIEVQDCESALDACYEMILKLHKLKML